MSEGTRVPFPRIPLAGPPRAEAIVVTQEVLRNDALDQITVLCLVGWPLVEAEKHYREWLHSLVDDVVDGGVAEWLYVESGATGATDEAAS